MHEPSCVHWDHEIHAEPLVELGRSTAGAVLVLAQEHVGARGVAPHGGALLGKAAEASEAWESGAALARKHVGGATWRSPVGRAVRRDARRDNDVPRR